MPLHSSEINTAVFDERGVMVHLNGLGYLHVRISPGSRRCSQPDNVRNDARRLRVDRRHLHAILHLFRNVKQHQRARDGQEQRCLRQVEPRANPPSKPEAHRAGIALRGFPIDGDVAFRFELEWIRISLCIVEHVPVKKIGDVRSASQFPMADNQLNLLTNQRLTIIIDPFGTAYPRIRLSSIALCGTPAVCVECSRPESRGKGGRTNRWVRRCSSATLRGRQRWYRADFPGPRA